ncbi:MULTISPECIES: bifunctional protein-serine/threonine kinase/phosphatase [unclassified Oleiphilus]|jgi:protein phosphatase|uniref:bifunctional protein-serine/threonine kinase/phosphatase n=4 Tax=Oleiphilus TaxID=141450 RepID=UPI0007C2C15B|nr:MULTISPECIES: bifunctional protein-serine/threonine kinase/phosphatase [unclassified Oleiphilus]KZY42323.1 serine/threonine protein kinase [Oleiphilus sp. HI0050]KZY75166.1 serine/threonine protein kinase [Oleiphilus sp. HI0069]KZY82596.1 serine/threonine protein kinase [Oleiphilus sp. HI0068]KZY85122.1 serine/threonine protein kinase [Oleiphilus sp. HI0072]KZY58965.1 serine/threonine protein kinase [Oleiphilus sp. HI0061]
MAQILKIDAAFSTDAGIKPINEDSAGVKVPEDSYLLNNKGCALVVADGVSSAEAGREASHTAVERFIEEYFQTPDTWSVSKCGEQILSTINLKLFRKSHEFSSDTKGYLSTFSSIVIKGRTAHFFHVGDSRIFLLREGEFAQCTTDHVASLGGGKTFLTRAIGMDNRLHLDYGRIPLEAGDRLLLCSDGVHDFIEEARIIETLAMDQPAEFIADKFLDLAREGETDDNISAVVGIVEQLPFENLDDYSAKLTRLPFPPALEKGMKLDGFVVQKELFASSRSQLYLVKDEVSGELLAMKTPSPNFEEDTAYIDRFIQEEWIGIRIQHPNVVKIIRQDRKRSFLYYLMEYVEGEGLDKWLRKNQPPSPKRAINIVKQVAEGLKAFHQNEAVHQDLKPGNIMVTEEGKALVLDFGSVFVAGLSECVSPIIPDGVLGTAGYSDPLYLRGHNPGIQGDVYSLATITYEMFTGTLPYGDKIEQCRSAFDYDQLRYTEASSNNPVIPEWFDGALKRGTSFDLEERYRTIDDFMKDLLQPNPEFLKADPVVQKSANTLMFWKLLSGFWFVTFLLLIYLFSQNS